MGLDMYLYRDLYVKNWDHFPPEQRTLVTLQRGAGPPQVRPQVTYLREEVGYWRKANAIHNWFVQECQGGVDDQRYQRVGIEQLNKLHTLVKQVLEDRTQAAELLPPTSGFFFGSTEIDEWYFTDLEHTVKVLDQIKQEPDWERHTYYYHGDW